MDRIPVPNKVDADLKDVLHQIMDEAIGSIIRLDSDVTTLGDELQVNQIGFNPTTSRLFINLFGTTYRVALTAV